MLHLPCHLSDLICIDIRVVAFSHLASIYLDQPHTNPYPHRTYPSHHIMSSSSSHGSESPQPCSHRTSHETFPTTSETDASNTASNEFIKEHNDESLSVFEGSNVSRKRRNVFEVELIPQGDRWKGGQGAVRTGYAIAVATRCKKTMYPPMSEERAKELEFVISVLKMAPPGSCIMEIFQYEQEILRIEKMDVHMRVDVTCGYCDGEDVSRLHERFEKARMRIPEKYLWIVYRDIIKALDYLQHGTGSPLRYGYTWRPIVHLDVKPGNIVFSSDPQDPTGCPTAKLIDVDMTGMYDDARPETQLWQHGTFQYQPPEQWLDYESPRATPAGDVYALGATVYHLATGMKTSSGWCCGGRACVGPEFCQGHLDGEELSQWKEEQEAEIQRPLDNSRLVNTEVEVKRFERRTVRRAAMHISSIGLGSDGYSEELDWWVGEPLKIDSDARMKVAFLFEHMVLAAHKRIAELKDEAPRPLVEDRQQLGRAGEDNAAAASDERDDSICPPASEYDAQKIARLQAKLCDAPVKFTYPTLEDCKLGNELSMNVGKMLGIEQEAVVVDWENPLPKDDESLYTKFKSQW